MSRRPRSVVALPTFGYLILPRGASSMLAPTLVYSSAWLRTPRGGSSSCRAHGRLTASRAMHTSTSGRSSGTHPLWIPPLCWPSLIRPLSGIHSQTTCACPVIRVAPATSWSCLSGLGHGILSRMPTSQLAATGRGGFTGGTRRPLPQTGPRCLLLLHILMRLFLLPHRLALLGVPRVRGREDPRQLHWSCQRRVLGILGFCIRSPPRLWVKLGTGRAHPAQGYPPNF